MKEETPEKLLSPKRAIVFSEQNSTVKIFKYLCIQAHFAIVIFDGKVQLTPVK